MPYKALSERVKRQKNLRKKHDIMQNAVAAYAKEQLKPAVKRRGARSIATQFKIPNQWRTIINQYKGGRSQLRTTTATTMRRRKKKSNFSRLCKPTVLGCFRLAA